MHLCGNIFHRLFFFWDAEPNLLEDAAERKMYVHLHLVI